MPKFNVFRERIITEKYLSEIQLFRKSIFEDATVETCTIILHNEKPNKKTTYSFKEIKGEPNLFVGEKQNQIQLELLNNGIPLTNPIIVMRLRQCNFAAAVGVGHS